MSTPTRSQDMPGEAGSEDGHVVLDGPAGIAVTMTPAAAAETARRLHDAAHQAAAGPVEENAAGDDG